MNVVMSQLRYSLLPAGTLTSLVFLLLARFSLASDYVSQCGQDNYTWPQPHRSYDHRPPSDPFCQALYAFCPTGMEDNTMPRFPDGDTIYVFALQAPIWESKYGSMLKKWDLMHDAIGFYHVESGRNFTLEWYELFQLFNSTFPHTLQDGQLMWCNQGAACIFEGIDDIHWKENGTLVKIADITGTTFNKFAEWTEENNTTFIYYETWTVMDYPGGKVYFKPYDCSSWAILAYDMLHQFGAVFNQSVHLNFTKAVLYTHQEPQCVGNATTIYQDERLMSQIHWFYSHFKKGPIMNIFFQLYTYFISLFPTDVFYVFYNEEYWLLKPRYPFFRAVYEHVPLPS